MTKEQQQRALLLLRATVELMNNNEDVNYVESIFETTACWDDAECDGYCLRDDINYLLEEIQPPVN